MPWAVVAAGGRFFGFHDATTKAWQGNREKPPTADGYAKFVASAIALLVAGFFTFPFGRMPGAWLFG